MHAFSLLICSILTHEHAKGVLGKVTQLVKFFKLILLSAARLQHHSKQLGINKSQRASPNWRHKNWRHPTARASRQCGQLYSLSAS
jgi:hypothetical protein